MKKTIAWILVLVLCFGMFAGCAEKPVESTPAGTTAGAQENEGLNKAAKYLKALYNTASVETGIDYERTTVVPVGKVKYTVTWAVDVAEDLVKIVPGENNTVTIDVNEDNTTETPYKLTATVSDDAGNTKEVVFDHILPKAVAKDGTEFSVLEIIEMGAAKEHNTYTDYSYKVTGVITEVYNTTYGNMYITDGEGNTLTIYGTYSADGTVRYDAMEVKPVAGDTVTIYGIVGQYNGTPQIKNGWIVAHTPGTGEVPTLPADPSDPAADSTLTIEQAIALGTSKEHNTYTVGKYYVTGKITEVYNDQYGNMYITDGNGNTLTVYGTYSADGSQRYDAMATKPVAGDTVTIYGVIGQYNGTPQIKNGWITAHTAAGSTGGSTGGSNNSGNNNSGTTTPSVPATLAEQIAAANKLANKEYLPYESTITGTITDTPQVSSYTAGAYKFTVSDGTNTLLCYYVPVTGGTPAKGDKVTVTGKLTAYNGTAQFDDTASAVITEKAPTPPSSSLSVVDAPEVGKAYKFGMVQGNLNATYYLAGGMNGYYMATTTDASAAINVYLEETTGGYYLYTDYSGTKQYINMVISTTHVNGAYEATASTVYTWDSDAKTLVANMQPEGKDTAEPYWFGTRSDKSYDTVGPCAVSYNGFYCQFYA